MVAKPVTVGVVGVIVLASALVLNYFVLPGEEGGTATAVAPPPKPAATAPKPGDGPTRNTAPAATAPRPAAGATASAGAAATTPAAAVARLGAADAAPPPKPAAPREPSFDVVRVDPDGNAVLAGRGAPNTEIAIVDGGEEIGRVTTDSRGEWVFIPDAKLAPGQRVLFLRQPGSGPVASTGEASDSVVLVIPEKGRDIAGRPASGPSTPLVMLVPKDEPGADGKAAARVLQAPAAGPLAGNAGIPERTAGAPGAPPVPDGQAAAGGEAAAGRMAAVAAGAVPAASATSGPGPSTSGPSTSGPSTSGPSTSAPTSSAPTSSAPTSSAPTSSAPAESSPAGATPAGGGAPAPRAIAGAQPPASPPATTGAAPAARTAPQESTAAAPVRAAGSDAAPGVPTEPAPMVSAYPETAAGPSEKAGAAPPEVAVDVIDYDDKGEVVFSGRADPGARVEVFIDDKSVGGTGADAGGRWTMRPEAPVAPGSYQLRVDKVAAGGTVEARVAFPFVRANPLTELPNNRLVVIQPGNNLWRIATRVYGSGVRYVEIFDANKDQILDPDLIYPGQVFGLPRTN